MHASILVRILLTLLIGAFYAFSSMAQESAVLSFPQTSIGNSATWYSLKALDDRGIAIHIVPPNPYQHLQVTMIFDESHAEKLSAIWLAQDGVDQVLVDNFIEKSTALNQGIFVLQQAILGEEGTLVFKGDPQALAGILEIRLNWVDILTIFGNESANVPILTQEGGRAMLASDLAGDHQDLSDQNRGEVVRAVLSRPITSLSKGIAFKVPLLSPVVRVRFETKIIGLSPEAELKISVNGFPIQRLAVETPSLNDPGYIEQFGNLTYAGWRKAAAILPSEDFQKGDNYIVIESNEEITEAFIKETILESVFSSKDEGTHALSQRFEREWEENPLKEMAPSFRFSLP